MFSLGCAGGTESMQFPSWSNDDSHETNVCKSTAYVTTVKNSMEEIGLQRYTPGEPSQDWELRSTCSKKMNFKLRHKIVRSSLPSLGILNMMALIEN